MAYKYKEPAYYGDMPIAPELKPSMDWHPDHGGGGGSGEVTEIDFKKVKVYNAPWLKTKTLNEMVADLTKNPKTLNQTIDLLDELIERMRLCATASAVTGDLDTPQYS